MSYTMKIVFKISTIFLMLLVSVPKAHLSRINVQAGDKVKQGKIIGLEGGASTDPNHGDSTGHHLHFEIRMKSGYGNHVNPTDYI